MGIGVSIVIAAIGAILYFATDATVSGLNLDVVGIILMVAGAVGLLWSLIVMAMARSRRPSDEVVVEREYGRPVYPGDDLRA